MFLHKNTSKNPHFTLRFRMCQAQASSIKQYFLKRKLEVQTIMQDPRLVLVLLYPSNVSASSIPVRCSREGRATYYAEFVRNSTSTVVRIKLAMTCNTLWTLRVYRGP